MKALFPAFMLTTMLAIVTLATAQDHDAEAPAGAEVKSEMYGLISQINAAPGERDQLVAILLGGSNDMPGCLSYIVAKDPANPNAIWITEVWESQESHRASLTLPAVQDAIARGRPLIANIGQRITTTPAGGHGLAEPATPKQ